ncbi:hypothetical protein F3Y22_tig00001728pilonHSYRG00059 [Hibiscus syriacus]|uniref:Hydroxyproline O-arabinosyltransferase-like domain-containing protein n=1 Tax=Hibiscus syriacus TaxID=106335 RepID=A0A6A3CZE5_HIBSY|nr:hypothetical protein F3Y22_tig00001728pilonHSYRG00059 [Hibiscus syriacus]
MTSTPKAIGVEMECCSGHGELDSCSGWPNLDLGRWCNGSKKADVKEDYILMEEPDHIIVKPILNLSKAGHGAAFPFFYIEPKKYESVLRKYFPENKGPITNIDPIGNSPVIIAKDSLEKIAPTWMNVSLAMKKDPETDKAFGWVFEMYAYAVCLPCRVDSRKKGYVLGFWNSSEISISGKLTYGKIGEWRFDKRSFTTAALPKNLPLPPPVVPQSVVQRKRRILLEGPYGARMLCSLLFGVATSRNGLRTVSFYFRLMLFLLCLNDGVTHIGTEALDPVLMLLPRKKGVVDMDPEDWF